MNDPTLDEIQDVFQRHGEWYKNQFEHTKEMYGSHLNDNGHIIPTDEIDLLLGLMYAYKQEGKDITKVKFDATIDAFVEFDNYRKQTKENINDNRLKKAAIQMTAKRVDKKVQCQKSLTKFIELKDKDPDRSVRDIWKEIDKGNLDYGSLNNWVKKYNKNLDALKYAQEK